MPTRRTKRGAKRTPLRRDCDVLVCGASFAGLAVARELAGSGARVLIVDRYEIGERQTSACAAPTEWLDAMGAGASIKQTFGELVVHTPARHHPHAPPVDVLDLRLPGAVRAAVPAAATPSSRPRRWTGGRARSCIRTGVTWTRRWSSTAWVGAACSAPTATSPPTRRSRAGWRSTRAEPRTSWRSGSTAATCPPATAGASPPTTRSGSASAPSTPASASRTPTVRLARDLDRDPVRYQGNWIPHRLRDATEDEVFFAGDSAGHCLPLTAEGIRTAFYFGIACGRELRRVIDGRATREMALRRYAAFSARHEWQFDGCCASSGWSRGCPPACWRSRCAE